MNIFIDTTLLYNDPFLKNNYNRNLFKLVDGLNGKIFISKVVLEESKEKLRINLENAQNNLLKDISEFNKYSNSKIDVEDDLKDIDQYVKKFENYYKNLESKDLVKIVDYKNSYLPEVVKRAIKRKKPFAPGNKQEFRDCLIWLSYSEMAERDDLENCFFITNNVSDFYDNDKESLHPELRKDSSKFTLYKISKHLIQNEEDLISKMKNKRLKELFDEIMFTDKELAKLLNNKKKSYISEIYDYISKISSSLFDMSNYKYEDTVITLDDVIIKNINNWEKDLIGDEIIISCNFITECLISKIMFKERIDGSFANAQKGIIENIELTISFSANFEKRYDNFETDNISIIS